MTTVQIKVPNWLDFIFTCPLLTYRLLRYGYTYRRIYLDEGLWTLVDPQDYYRFGCFKWCLDGHDGKFYAVRGARIGTDNIKKVRLHREITNAPKGRFVDHRNSNSLDNRRENLRIATRCQNMQNMRRRKNKKNTTSQFIGVYFDKDRHLWAYQLKANRKVVSVGRFNTEVEAARARDAAAVKYHGEFARLNFDEKI